MMTVNEVSKLTGVSVRTLQYYDKIGLLIPCKHTPSGYRLYGNADLEKLQQILLFRELEFPLKEIKAIMDNPSYDKNKALKQQIELLTLKKEHLENLINFATWLKAIGVNAMDFSAFDTKKLDEYSARAKEQWGKTEEYREFAEKDKNRTEEDNQKLAQDMMNIFAELGTLRNGNPADEQAQRLVKKLQDYITENFYTCSDKILAALGKMYAGGGELSENIDRAGGDGTAVFSAKAIEAYIAGKS